MWMFATKWTSVSQDIHANRLNISFVRIPETSQKQVKDKSQTFVSAEVLGKLVQWNLYFSICGFIHDCQGGQTQTCRRFLRSVVHYLYLYADVMLITHVFQACVHLDDILNFSLVSSVFPFAVLANILQVVLYLRLL